MSPRRWSLTLLALLACAGKTPGGAMSPEECQAEVAAEKERAGREGRDPKPIVQRGQLTTNLLESRARVTFDMTKDAPDNALVMVARIFVDPQGAVADVTVEEPSGVRSFDAAVVAMMKKWQHRPKMVDCAPAPYDYPMKYSHVYQR